VRLAPLALLAVAAALAGCGSGSDPRAATPTQTAPPPPSPKQTVVWAVGDGADGSAAAKTLAALIAKDRPARFLYLGDVYPAGTQGDFQRGYAPTYGRLRKLTDATSGNHDWPNRRLGFLPYWQAARGRAQRPYYSFRLAGWRFLDLNSEAPHGAGSSQLSWLRGQLKPPGTCRLGFWHRPRFSAGPHGDAPDMSPVWNAMRHRARLVLTGHDHVLERYRLRDGLSEYVAGAGGANLYSLHGDPRLAFARAGTTGALRMLLEPGKATLEFRSSSGRLLDRSRVTCRA
jgi:hypothetical protein